MKIRINKKFIVITLVLFLAEVGIALFVHDSFIRPFIGDVLVVIIIYSFVRIFYSKRPVWCAVGVFLFACIVEILQLFQIVRILGLEQNVIARIIIGSTFDWMDILAYGIGTALILCAILFSNIINTKKISQSV